MATKSKVKKRKLPADLHEAESLVQTANLGTVAVSEASNLVENHHCKVNIYTLSGAVEAEKVTLKCNKCKVTYNYSMWDASMTMASCSMNIPESLSKPMIRPTLRGECWNSSVH